MIPTRPARLAASVVCVLVAVSACGGDSKQTKDAQSAAAAASAVLAALSSAAAALPPAASSAAAAVSSIAASAAAAASSAGAGATGTGGCDEALLNITAATKSGGYVTAVNVIGGCTTASISTSLKKDADGVAAAMGICEIAASEAYSHGVGAVSVESVDGKELAIGVKGASCIGEP